MGYQNYKPKDINERKFVEEPFLQQLRELGWTVLDLERDQSPADTFRESFTEVVMLPVLREQLKTINPWLEDNQVDEVIKQLTVSVPSNNLLENNHYVFNLLQENTSVAENRQTGEQSPTVRFVDFDSPERLNNNSFIAVCQFKVRILGTDRHIIPDIVLLLNGLPIAVVECKSHKIKEPIPEAIDQLNRYSEQRGASKEGCPPLFYYNQFVIVTCRNQAKFGTITTRNEKHFYRWADPYPRKLDELEHGVSSPNDQQRLVAGMLDRNNLLNIIRTFTLFSVTDEGDTIKVVGRYQQFRAVKTAVQRLLTKNTPRERGGIIWHTQGSGKSLTMMFMVREMYRHAALSQWKVIFVTDRTQLEDQLGETGKNIGFTVKVADSIKKLKELLRTDSSDLVMAMIHKFRETELSEMFPELNASSNILIMTDEAHRSQYSLLGSNLDRAVPNATRIGYTGTPIEATKRLFGEYIHKYTMRDAIADGVTLEIVYEGRTHNAEVEDQPGMDKKFHDVFSDYKLAERMDILGFGSRDAYLEAESTIEAKAKDMMAHYLTHVFINGFKAQVVATSREAAVRYRSYLCLALADQIEALEKANPNHLDIERLKHLRIAVVISSGNNDLPHLKLHADKGKHAKIIKSFKLPFDGERDGTKGDTGIVVVNNMLLTGFDAPIEQVMYLDKVIIAHGLLQAIARVNRVGGKDKDKGFVVDYVGIGHHLKKAIDMYDAEEQKEIRDTLSFPEEELRDLKDKYRAIMALLAEHGLTDLTDQDAFFDLFYNEDIRFAYLLAFKELTRCMNLVYPAKEALEYRPDYQALTAINVMAAKHLQDERLSMKGIPEKLRGITDDYLKSKGIDQKIAPISILDDKFEADVGNKKRKKTKAAAVEHAIRHHIEVEMDDDPELQASFAEALKAIMQEHQENWDKIYEELEKLRKKMREADKEPTYGLHKKKQMPLFRLIKREIHGDNDLDEDQVAVMVNLTQQLFDLIAREIALTGFWESIPAKNKLEGELQKLLLSVAYIQLPNIIQNRKHIISRIMELTYKLNDTILYTD